jgi:hypothetical protein
MVAFWMAGLEHRPERSAEICIAEMFATTPTPIPRWSSTGCGPISADNATPTAACRPRRVGNRLERVYEAAHPECDCGV